MANSKVTPRAIIIFLDKLIEISQEYYSQRFYPKIRINENNEYPLFLKEHITKAYGKMQSDLSSYISSAVTHPEWKERILLLLSNFGDKTQIGYGEIGEYIVNEQEGDARELLAFLEHLGVLNCKNKTLDLETRIYDIPIILQKNWAQANGTI